METIEFIKKHGIQGLKDELKIIVKEYDSGLIVLNYDQIHSPEAHPVVMECRGLIIDKDLNIVSRSFDRFFNQGQHGAGDDLNFTDHDCVVYDKVDGSLIKIYYHDGKWNVSTRGTAYAESGVNGFDITFKGLVFKALNILDDDDFQSRCEYLNKENTYIFEVTSMENRVVTRYNDCTLWLLAVRNNSTGEYQSTALSSEFGHNYPKLYEFTSVEDCINAAKNLPDLAEGYVVYKKGIPVCKIKSPAYVAVHHIKGDGLTPKRIAQLVLMNEQDEYLKYFPEDSVYFKPYTETLALRINYMVGVYSLWKDIESQKEFALAVKHHPFASVLFQARQKGGNVIECFHQQRESWKIDFLIKEVKGYV